ncbi:MAG TPA: LD-carboxypeptidase [Candidatus Caenarcaniphilales bacterium]
MSSLCCQLPPPLQPGDRLRVILPSGTLREPNALRQGINIWQSRGYQVELSPGFDQQWGYLAGRDDDRRQQLEIALQDPSCRGILCARGGYGGTRLLEEWRWPQSCSKCSLAFQTSLASSGAWRNKVSLACMVLF